MKMGVVEETVSLPLLLGRAFTFWWTSFVYDNVTRLFVIGSGNGMENGS
jgi:hypothetical protein